VEKDVSYSDTTKTVFDLTIEGLTQETTQDVMEILQTALAEENIHNVDHVTEQLLTVIKKADENAD
jgi:hypothetical protein